VQLPAALGDGAGGGAPLQEGGAVPAPPGHQGLGVAPGPARQRQVGADVRPHVGRRLREGGRGCGWWWWLDGGGSEIRFLGGEERSLKKEEEDGGNSR